MEVLCGQRQTVSEDQEMPGTELGNLEQFISCSLHNHIIKNPGHTPRNMSVNKVGNLVLRLCSAAGQHSPGNYCSFIFIISALFNLVAHLFINNPKPQVWAATGKLLGLFYSKSRGEKYFCQCRLPCEVV